MRELKPGQVIYSRRIPSPRSAGKRRRWGWLAFVALTGITTITVTHSDGPAKPVAHQCGSPVGVKGSHGGGGGTITIAP